MKYLVCENQKEAALAQKSLNNKGIHGVKVVVIELPGSILELELEKNQIKEEEGGNEKLSVRCFGNFEVFANGEALRFARSKSKELFAYLIDRRGAMLNLEQIRSILWEEAKDLEVKKSYTRTLLADIRKTLSLAGFSDVLINHRNSYGVNEKKLSCDYYDYIEGRATTPFAGEYMTQYPWGENTLGFLTRMSKKA